MKAVRKKIVPPFEMPPWIPPERFVVVKTVLFLARIRGDADLFVEFAAGRFIGHIDAAAFDIEFPAMIEAAQSVFFVTTEKQRGAAVRAHVIDQADLAIGVAEGDEIFAEQSHA